MALGYMRTRVQFGKPIGSFQALQHKAADLYVQQELARAVLDDAVRELDASGAGDERAQARQPLQGARSSDAGLRVTREVIQLHGAIGFTDEYDAGLYLKRALVLSAWLGNATRASAPLCASSRAGWSRYSSALLKRVPGSTHDPSRRPRAGDLRCLRQRAPEPVAAGDRRAHPHAQDDGVPPRRRRWSARAS